MSLAVFNMNSAEFLLILAVILVLLGARHIPSSLAGLRWEKPGSDGRGAGFNPALWIAQGFGAGKIPVAPGLFGSLEGLLWFLMLLALQSPVAYVIGALLGAALSVWLCGKAEETLSQRDPGSVVLDEIIAMPFCFLGWLGFLYFKHGFWPEPAHFLSARTWPLTLAVFVLFRLFDVAKPWPVHQSQSLPGGWGVTMDDILAALYVNAVVLIAFALRR